jgi:hypothetical protein
MAAWRGRWPGRSPAGAAGQTAQPGRPARGPVGAAGAEAAQPGREVSRPTPGLEGGKPSRGTELGARPGLACRPSRERMKLGRPGKKYSGLGGIEGAGPPGLQDHSGLAKYIPAWAPIIRPNLTINCFLIFLHI